MLTVNGTLQRCLKDLRERFAKCGITASEAIVPFRETAVKSAEMNPTKSPEGIRGKFVATSVASFVSVTIQSALLPESVIEFLQHSANTIQVLQDQDRPTQGEETSDDVTTDRTAQIMKPGDFWNKLSALLDAAGPEWKGTADQIWAFGAKRIGPNLLLDKTGASSRSLRAKSQLIADAQEQGKSAAEVAELVSRMNDARLDDDTAATQTDDKAAQRLLSVFDNNIETGFQTATYQGPLCAEPVTGMAYFVESIDISSGEDEDESCELSSLALIFVSTLIAFFCFPVKGRMPQVTGSLITAVRDACRHGLLDWSPRIMLAMYSCDIQASSEYLMGSIFAAFDAHHSDALASADVLGKVYAVVARRRGRIVSEEMKEGTSFFTVRALLPVVESFGFADGQLPLPRMSTDLWLTLNIHIFAEIRKRTSGAASPLLIFNG